VATTISGFVAIIAVGALNAIAGSAHAVNRVTESTSEIRFAAKLLTRDLANLYRDVNPQNMKLVGASGDAAQGGPPSLTFYMVGRAKARANQPEGDVYEVEYFLGSRTLSEQGGEATEAPEESTILFRRLWPNPDRDRTPGGVLTPIAENIGLFQLRFFDGTQLSEEWTEDMRSLPEYLEVTLATMPPEKGDPLVETIMVTFPRLSRSVPIAGPTGETAEGEPGQSQTENLLQGSSSGSTEPPSGPGGSSGR